MSRRRLRLPDSSDATAGDGSASGEKPTERVTWPVLGWRRGLALRCVSFVSSLTTRSSVVPLP
jgi:hypothetical protein